MRKIHRLTAVVLAISLALACTPAEERAEQAREAVEESIARGDREAALDAIEDLRSGAPDTADAQLELAQLLVQCALQVPELELCLGAQYQRVRVLLALGRDAVRDAVGSRCPGVAAVRRGCCL